MAVADVDHAFGIQDDDFSLDTDPPESPLVRRVVPLPRRLAPEEDTQKRKVASEFEVFGSAYTGSMAQHPYYLPLFSANGSVSALLASAAADQNAADFLSNGVVDGTDSIDDITAYADIDSRHVVDSDAIEALPSCRSPFAFGQDGGIYMDQFTHPGNTKKRKVPVTAHGRTVDDILPSEELADRSFLTDRILTANAQYYPINAFLAKKSRISKATKANLQMKEMLKSRRRQLAPVLGLLLQNDSLALDHSLATLTSLYRQARDADGVEVGPAIRMSQREKKRKARALDAKAKREALRTLPPNGIATKPLSGEFSFEHECLTSLRHKSTTEEVAILQKRFNSELAKQNAKAAEAAKEAAAVVNQMQKSTKRSGERGQGLGNSGAAAQQSQTPQSQQQRSGSGTLTPVQTEKTAGSKSKAKKKKRSAMANASNPHHLRNYVPSRLPNAGNGHAQGGVGAQNSLGPFPLRFLSAGLSSRKYGGGDLPRVNLTNPGEEWICAFCEYNLFYGSDQEYRKAIRQRKKILTRRRRAAERAAAAAAGKRKGVAAADHFDDEDEEDFEDDIDDYDYGAGDLLNGIGSSGTEQDRDRDKGTTEDGGGGSGVS